MTRSSPSSIQSSYLENIQQGSQLSGILKIDRVRTFIEQDQF